MNNSRISVRYSKAIFNSAIEKKLLTEVYQDMIFITGLCKITGDERAARQSDNSSLKEEGYFA